METGVSPGEHRADSSANMETMNQPKVTLHWLEVSRSHRILWLLEELQIPYELKTYKRGKDKLADPALKKVHPLGKSPVITIEVPGRAEPLVIAESAAIAEYLCDHFGKNTGLLPKRYQDGEEGKLGGETEGWLRFRHYMHYAEGSIMPLMLISFLMLNIKSAPVPFFIKPVTNGVANRIISLYLQPNFENHYKFLESQLDTSPNGGQYLCGKELTAADILMSYPLEAGESRSGLTKEQFPKIWAYIELLHSREAYKRSVEKIKLVEGSFKTNL